MKFSAKIRPWFRKQDGWWYVTRRINGKRVQQKLAEGKDNQDAAYQKYHEIMAAAGAVETCPDVTFNELAYLFLAWSKQNHDDKTVAWYGRFVSGFDDFYTGQVMQLRKGHVEAWLNQHDWSQSTRRQAISCVKRVVNWGYEQGLIEKIPEGLRSLKRPPMNRREKVLSSAEHEKLLRNTDAAFGQFLTALRETGARPGEIRTVTADMVDLKLGVWILPDHVTVHPSEPTPRGSRGSWPVFR